MGEGGAAARMAYRVALAVLLLLLTGAALTYRQRMLFLDPAFLTYEILDGGWPVISEHRYGAYVTQAFPWLTGRMGLPLPAVLLAYSLSFYLFYTAVVLVVGGRWKQYGLATLLVCYLTLIVSDGYYWPNNEIHQAVAYLILFLGAYTYVDTRKQGVTWWQYLLLSLLVVLATNTHLLVAPSLAYLWIYLGLEGVHQPWRRAQVRRWLCFSLVIGCGGVARYAWSRDSWYDGHKLKGVANLSWDTLTASLTNGQSTTMQQYLLHDYWLLLPVALLGAAALLRERRWCQLAATVGAAAGYYLLVCLTYPGAFDRDMLFYVESEWMGFGLILATPFVLHFIPLLRNRAKVAALGMLLVFGIRLAAIAGSYGYFDRRLTNLTTLVGELRELPGTKFVLEPADAYAPYFGMHWGLPNETLLQATLGGQEPAVTLKPLSPGQYDTLSPRVYLGSFRIEPIRAMNGTYFSLDSLQPYRNLTARERDAIAAKLQKLPDR
ncbi:hypothetical protein [Lewinella sp. IMCC34183]|uniref:hypothetical protein n=1 Tax=Lewinella sp. IMCC34183 TaxID=2248762 RepID=UPI000E24C025|nr:hypothetical protein [Lewinella sp. IMCC34183]